MRPRTAPRDPGRMLSGTLNALLNRLYEGRAECTALGEALWIVAALALPTEGHFRAGAAQLSRAMDLRVRGRRRGRGGKCPGRRTGVPRPL